MAFVTADRVTDTSFTTGTGSVTLASTPPTGYRSFASVLTVGDTFYYCIQSQTTGEWETGVGTYASENIFARTTVLASSNNNNLVSFSSGQKTVFLTLAATKTAQLGSNNAVTEKIYDKGGAVFNVKAYGANGDTATLTPSSVSITAGANILTVIGANFQASDVGKAITVQGGGPGNTGGYMLTTITSYISATRIGLAINATNTLSGTATNIIYGTDDTAAAQAAFNAAQNSDTGGLVYFPSGTYYLSSALTFIFSYNSYANAGIQGAGMEGSILYWPKSNGISLSLQFYNQAFAIRDLTFTTGTNLNLTNNYTALAVSGPSTFVGTQSDISNASFRGITGNVYWQKSIDVSGYGIVNFNNLWFTSPTDNGNVIGVSIEGTSSTGNLSVYNFFDCNWSGGGTHVTIGSYIQGVVFDACSFGAAYVAINVPAGESGGSYGPIGGILIANSSFVDHSTTINIQSKVQTLQITNNFIIVGDSQNGIYVTSASSATPSEGITIVGNQFWNFDAPYLGQGIEFDNCKGAIITGNIFTGLAKGVSLNANSSFVNVQSNTYVNVATDVTNSGTSNTIGGGSK